MNMRKPNSLLLFLILSILIVVRGVDINAIQLNSQNGELRNINLSSLGIATGPYTFSSSTKSQFVSIQPITSQTSSFTPQVIQILNSFVLQLDNGFSQKAQLFLNSISSPSVYLSIYSIQNLLNGTQDIQEISSFNISNMVGHLENPIVSLYSKGQGLIVYSGNSTSTMQQFSLDSENNFIFLEAQSQMTNSTEILSLMSPQNDIYYLSYQASIIQIDLYQIKDSIPVQVAQSQKSCISFQNTVATLIKNNIALTLRCIFPDYSILYFQEFTINYSSNQIISVRSNNIGYSQNPSSYNVGNVENVYFTQNILYFIEYFPQSPSTLQLTLLEKNFYQLQQSSFLFTLPEDTSTIINSFISQNADLITVVSHSSVIGFLVSSQSIIFQYPFSSVTSYSQEKDYLSISADQYGSQILVTFAVSQENTIQFTANSLSTNIPLLAFIQSEDTQIYSVSLQNDPLQRTLQIASTQFTVSPPTQIISDTLNNYLVSTVETNDISIPLDQIILGSDLTFSASKFTSDSSSVSGNSQFIQFNKYEVSNYIQVMQSVTNVYASYDNIVLIQYPAPTNPPDEQRYDCQYYLIYNNRLNFFSQYSNCTIYSVDSAASFTLKPSKEVIFWTVQSLFYSKGFYVISTKTNCDMNSMFFFSFDRVHSILATSCDNLITVYQYYISSNNSDRIQFMSFLLNYPNDIPNVQSILLSPDGILKVTDDSSVYAFDVTSKVYIGQVTVSQDIKIATGKIVLFASSFIYITPNQIYQLSYNSFQQSTATALRQLLSLSYTWKINEDFSNVYESSDINSNQEYLIVPANNLQGKSFHLLYRLNDVSSQNQFYISIPFLATQNLLFTPNFIGYLSNNNYLFLYSFDYFFSIDVKSSIEASDFQEGISFQMDSQISVQNSGQVDQQPQTMDLSVIIQRDVSSDNGTINQSSQQVQNLQSYFLKNPLQAGSQLSFSDNEIYNANIFGWEIQQVDTEINLDATIQQRVILQQINNSNDYTDMITVMPNLVLYATNNEIIFVNDTIFHSESDFSASFFLDDSQTKETSSDDKQLTIKVTVYALIFYQNLKDKVELQKIILQGIYNENPSSLNSSLISIDIFSLETDLLLTNTCNSIITDPFLGTIALIKPTDQDTSIIYQLNFDGENITLDDSPYLGISNSEIIGMSFNKIIGTTMFFTKEGSIYYNFAQTLSSFSIFSLKSSLIDLKLNLTFSSYLTQMSYLSSNIFLLEYDGFQLFYATLLSDEKSKLITQVFASSLNQQSGMMKFVGQAFSLNEGAQIIIASQFTGSTNNFAFLLFEPYSSTSLTNYLIKSSAFQKSESSLLSFRFISLSDSNKLQVFAKSTMVETNQLYLLEISNTVSLQINTVNLISGFNGEAFQIVPLLSPNLSTNCISFSVNYQGNGGGGGGGGGGSDKPDPSNTGQLLKFYVIILALIFM